MRYFVLDHISQNGPFVDNYSSFIAAGCSHSCQPADSVRALVGTDARRGKIAR